MPTINISLPAKLKADAEALIAAGEYVSFSDVVRDGLRNLIMQHRRNKSLDELTEEAMQDVLTGRATTLSTSKEIDNYFATLLKDE